MRSLRLLPVIIGVTAVAAVCSCSDDEITLSSDSSSSSITDGNKYLAVSIVMPDESNTRATGDYEDGDDAEYAVNSASSYFLFYDDAGEYSTYGVITDATWENNTDTNITTSAVVVSSTYEVEPTQLIAVLNYNGKISDLTGKNLNSIRKVTVSDTYGESGEFTMTNAVTIDSVGSTRYFDYLTSIDSTNLCDTYNEALENPVEIYVEREIAKVAITKTDANFNNSTVTDLDTIMYYDGSSYKTKYASLTMTGWGVNAINDEGYLIKDTTGLTASDYVGDSAKWYRTGERRFFWASDINYSDTTGVNYLSYNEVAELGLSTDAAYYHENTINADGQKKIAGDSVASTPTFIVVGKVTLTEETTEEETEEAKTRADDATETEEDGTFFYYHGTYYSPKGLLTVIYRDLDTDSLYRLTTSDSVLLSLEYVTDTLYSDSIAFVSDGNGGALVVDTLSGKDSITVSYKGERLSLAGVMNKTTYLDSDEDGSSDTDYYKDGMCYYQKPIEQITGTTVGGVSTWYGIVRNHYYSITLNSISGIGGPVPDGDEDLTIIPGEDQSFYIAATINILSWREVDQTFDF